MPKQTAVRIKDPDLLAECRELLARHIGEDLPTATVINAALTALKNQNIHKLITESDCQIWSLKATVATCAEVLNLLMDVGLLEPAKYEVEGIEHKGVRVLKDGIPINAEDKPETAAPDAPEWAVNLQKKMAVN
ncbi:MAG: hypothetical protein OXE42_01310 [Gammaproteobacteria bacterium]|nr:hypothetical protein [Gammaproteobacteria bacterium]